MNEIGRFTLDLGVAVFCGMVIGFERQWGQHPVGLRTNTLVAVGAALFVSLPHLLNPGADPLRIAATVVSGIGFLGAGIILREGLNVRGLTTAATLWCSAAVGTLAGTGQALAAAIGTGVILIVNVGLRPVAGWMDAHLKMAVKVETTYRIKVNCQKGQETLVRTILSRHINSQPKMSLHGLSLEEGGMGTAVVVIATVFSLERNDAFMNDLVSRLSIEPSVTGISWDRA